MADKVKSIQILSAKELRDYMWPIVSVQEKSAATFVFTVIDTTKPNLHGLMTLFTPSSIAEPSGMVEEVVSLVKPAWMTSTDSLCP